MQAQAASRGLGVMGVLYAEDFDEDAAVASAEPPPGAEPPEPEVIEPVFSLAELEEARTQARQAGRQDAEHSLIAARAQMLAQIAAGLAEAKAAGFALADALAQDIARCMLSMVAALLPALCGRHGEGEVRAIVRHVLPRLQDEPKVTIRVHPQMLAAVREEIGSLDPDLAGRMHLAGAEAVPPGDLKIGWQDGSAVRDTAAARRAVVDALAALGLLDRTLAKEDADA